MGQVFSVDRLKQTGKALKDVTVQGAIATKDGVVTATNATVVVNSLRSLFAYHAHGRT